MEDNRLELSKKGSKGIFLTTNELYKAALTKDFKTIAVVERKLTPALCFNRPPLSSIKKINEKNLYLSIENLLIKLSLSSNAGKNLNEWQIVELAGDIYQKYYYLSFEELILVLRRGRNGEYGTIYDRLDAAVIMSWFEKYDTSEERLTLVQNKRIAQVKEGEKEVSGSLNQILSNAAIKAILESMASKASPAIKAIPKEKTIFTSKELYIQKLKESLPFFTGDEMDEIRRGAIRNGAPYVIEIIDEFQKNNPMHGPGF